MSAQAIEKRRVGRSQARYFIPALEPPFAQPNSSSATPPSPTDLRMVGRVRLEGAKFPCLEKLSERTDASRPKPPHLTSCLFGRNPSTAVEQREMFYPKLAYYGLRNAFINYFGSAFVVKDADAAEIMRFVDNGNVLLMKEGLPPRLTENFTDWESLGLPDTGLAAFIVQQLDGNRDPVYKAVLTADGYLYLAGSLTEQVDDLAEPQEGSAFVVKSGDGAVQSLIDDGGNLKMRGYFLVDGIPYSLAQYESTDVYLPL